ncbi:uncharacterized protein [Leptinotarsa decemlineata]|uniref:uncharacterized protein n=1 Tax=Leptinotarsa decemlineata TaxID=7539 RepID=UPI000C252308|nr:uncharacterized protein LOC111507212 [Leptinotarsa decemlineata]
MEELNHWATMVKCSLCGEIPESAPLYQCPLQHQYCFTCINDLKKIYRGYIKGGSTCVICKISGVFTQSKINTDFLNKIKAKPGIGRPCRYNATPILNNSYIYSRTQQKNGICQTNGVNITVEGLFQLPSEELRKILGDRSDFSYSMVTKESTQFDKNSRQIHNSYTQTVSSQSRIPIKCPHKPCKKMVATSAFVTHFKYEHPDIIKYYVERGKELCIPCNMFMVEHNAHFCLAMITVYEINKIDVRKSKSSQSVIKTCGRFSQQVPISSFWLMVTGSIEKKPNLSCALYWLFSTSDDRYQSTIELSSKYDSISFSTFCGINTSQKFKFSHIAENLNCLIISRASICALLKEGPDVNLRITVH